jgi:hypothetical protein
MSDVTIEVDPWYLAGLQADVADAYVRQRLIDAGADLSHGRMTRWHDPSTRLIIFTWQGEPHGGNGS